MFKSAWLRSLSKALFQVFDLTAGTALGFDDNGQMKSLDEGGGGPTLNVPDLDDAEPLTGDELLAVDQSGLKKVSVLDIANFLPGLRWVLARDIPFGEWNDCGVNQTPIDVVTLPTGMLLYDIHVIPSNDYNDAEASAGGVLHFGWGALIGQEENKGFESEFPHPLDINSIDHWFPLRAPGVGLTLGRWEYEKSADESTASVLTGRPVLIADSATAGPLRTQTGGIAGDATAGSIKVLLLVQPSLDAL